MKKLVTSHGKNEVKPCVKMMRMLKQKPYHANHGCPSALYGNVSRSIPRAASARMNAMCDPEIQVHVMKPATAVMLRNQLKTFPPPFDKLRYAKSPIAAVHRTAGIGTPPLVVFLRKRGAQWSFARPRRIREPE